MLERCQVVLLAVLAGAWSCGSDDQQGLQQPSPIDIDIDIDAVATCLPDCYRAALADCKPQGPCVTDQALSANGADGELWTCFDNGVRIHTSRTTANGVVTTHKSVQSNGALCRNIESSEALAIAKFTIENSQAQTVASVQVTSFPGMTVACGGGEFELDRRTDCGQAALLLMVPEVAFPACGAGLGSCQGR